MSLPFPGVRYPTPIVTLPSPGLKKKKKKKKKKSWEIQDHCPLVQCVRDTRHGRVTRPNEHSLARHTSNETRLKIDVNKTRGPSSSLVRIDGSLPISLHHTCRVVYITRITSSAGQQTEEMQLQGHKCLIMINPRKSTIKHFIKDK